MAAIISRGSGSWLSDGHARPDVLVEAWPAEFAGARQASAHHVVSQLRATRWQGLDGLRHARRRAAGPMVADPVPAHGPSRHEHPGGDRCAIVPYRALAQ